VVIIDVASFATRVGLDADSVLLAQALTHSSYATEHDLDSNERLEFVGDAVVGLAVADHVVATYPTLNEGQASVLRSRVINENALADAARVLNLGAVLRVGKGVLKENGLERPSLLADAFEAVVAAVYLERGFEVAKAFVLDVLAEIIVVAAQSTSTLDPKTRLQQWAGFAGLGSPHYEVHAQGSSSDASFVAVVRVGSIEATGVGRSKKRAEAAAAIAAWEETRA
jgi:ribonuclease-3